MNTVEVDEPKIQAELAGAGAALEGEHIPGNQAPPPGAEQAPPQPPRMDWTKAAQGLVAMVDRIVCPNWKLTGEEKDALTGGTVLCLEAFFPEVRLDPRIQALAILGLVVVAIAEKRVDKDTGELAPLRAPAPAAPGDDTEHGVGDRAAA